MASSEEPAAEWGELLFCGSTDWAKIGRKDTSKKKDDVEEARRAEKYPSLNEPHRLAILQGVKVTFVASGASSCHCIALDLDGRCFTWGRNEQGQLGHGNTSDRHEPTIVAGLSKYNVTKAAAGKHHTVVVTADGISFSFGGNLHGQLGVGSLKADKEKSPTRTLVDGAASVSCGAEFTVWITDKEDNNIFSAGLPQFGQLGHGTDNEYNAKDSSVKLVYEPQPTPKAIAALRERKMTRVACGNNHSVATDSKGFVFTWGFGGHGRLGHKEQKDEWKPRQVDTFQRTNVVAPDGVIAAGAAFSAATAGGGQLYMWGKVKSTGENWMYPKPHMDLSGWNIRSMDSGATSSAVAADDSCITWGTASYGELGYGPTGPKSSANPKKVDSLNGTHVVCVACGVGQTLFVVSKEKNPEVLEKLPVFEPTEEEEADVESDQDKESQEDESEEESTAKRKGRGRGRGVSTAKRGRGAKSVGSSNASTGRGSATAKGTTRGRGRGKGKGK